MAKKSTPKDTPKSIYLEKIADHLKGQNKSLRKLIQNIESDSTDTPQSNQAIKE